MIIRKEKMDRWQIILFIICLCFLFGSVIGAIAANSLAPGQSGVLTEYTRNFMTAFTYESGKQAAFTEAFVKYGKYILLIWVCGFISPGAIVLFLIIMFRGLSYGFTTAFIASEYGIKGVLFAILGFIPQNIFLMPAFIAMSCTAMTFIMKNYTYNGPKGRIKRELQKHRTEFCIIFAGCMLITAMGCLVEINVSSFFTNFINLG